MPSVGNLGDGPSILQLMKWDSSVFPFDVSEFREASLSPSRKLLLLLSHQFEAFLLPLISENTGSTNKYDIVEYDSGVEESSSLPLSSTGENSCSCFSVPNVKSFTWGHFGDSYRGVENCPFRELLVVTDSENITVHAFRDSGEFNQSSLGAKYGFSHGDNDKVGGYENSCNSRAPKKWLKTSHIKLEYITSKSEFFVKFPEKFSLPPSVDIVSFGIYESTLAFLDFFRNGSQRATHSTSTAKEDHMVTDCVSPNSLRYEEGKAGYGASHPGSCYRCSKVFSSSWSCCIGLVLTYSGLESFGASEYHTPNMNKKFLVVIKLSQRGMHWMCLVDLWTVYSGSEISPEWVDFQFSINFLICLNASGLICILDPENGKVVTCMDVLRSCELNSIFEPSSLDQIKSVSGNGSVVLKDNLTYEVESGNNENRSRDVSTRVGQARSFKRLVVSSGSLLAAIDDHEIIYVAHVGGYNLPDYVSLSRPSLDECDMLTPWRIAGHEISGQKVFKYVQHHNVPRSNEVLAAVNHSRDAALSDFSGVSLVEKENLLVMDDEISLKIMNRVFLPFEKFEKVDSICFSPFGMTKLVTRYGEMDEKSYRIDHILLNVKSMVMDERDLQASFPLLRLPLHATQSSYVTKSISFCFQGCLYLVNQNGLSVVLPAVHVSLHFLPKEYSSHWLPNLTLDKNWIKYLPDIDICKRLSSNWQFEVLDRVLLFEDHEVADFICLQNEWDPKIARLRRMQLALHYLKLEEIEKSLDMLANVNLAEDGVLMLLFAALYHICSKRSDYEVAFAMRLLSLAACFATKTLHRYDSMVDRESPSYCTVKKELGTSCLYSGVLGCKFSETSIVRKTTEMAQFLEVIRDLQSRLTIKKRGLGQDPVLNDQDSPIIADMDLLQEVSPLPVIPLDSSSSDRVTTSENQNSGPVFPGTLPLLPVDTSGVIDLQEVYFPEKEYLKGKKLFPTENPRDMIARWVANHLDVKTVVKDAIHFGRLPLAVLQLHIQYKKEFDAEKDSHDIFKEVRDIGKSIAYELFLKGESGLAVATLERLGEDTEFLLRQLLFGTVRKALRSHIKEDMKSYGYLRLHENTTIERIFLIERLYPSSSFWATFYEKQKNAKEVNSSVILSEAENVNIVLHMYGNLIIECGEVDGVSCGSWEGVDLDSAFSEVCEDNAYAGYWACAAAWSDSWNNTTTDRIVLDQPLHMGVHVPWESQLEYNMSHNNLEDVIKLLDMIPSSLLLEVTLKVKLDSPHFSPGDGNNMKLLEYGIPIYGVEELEPLLFEIPNVKIFSSLSSIACTSWLKMKVEQELAKKYIFTREYWDNIAELVALFGRAGLLVHASGVSLHSKSTIDSQNLDLMNVVEKFKEDTNEAVHKLIIIYCSQYNLPRLMDIYLDHHNIPLNDISLSSLLGAAGSSQWAKWLLFSRIKGHEYDASFANARSTLSRHTALGSGLSVLQIDEIVRTVDDMAEGGGEMAALATMIHASSPLQDCIYSGSVKTHNNSSSYCTLENLKPALQQYSTLSKMLLSSCFSQDFSIYPYLSNPVNVSGKPAFSDYLRWRDGVFYSTDGDTSLLQILPCWFPKSVRKLVKLFLQGPLAWQTISDGISIGESSTYRSHSYAFDANVSAVTTAVSWEAAIQKNAEQLYSSFQENNFGVEHHLHRARPLSAFNYLLGARATKMKAVKVPSGLSNVQSDVQKILSPLTPDEESILSSVLPLAIVHFEDTSLVASCAFLLELCGLSANLLRADVAALRRISSYYQMEPHSPQPELVSPKGSPFHPVTNEDLTVTLARTLADNYIHPDHIRILEQKNSTNKNSAGKQQPSRALMIVLQHLEKASLPSLEEGKTCGFWLSTGTGDGYEFRNQQKTASEQWKLVTTFCQMHDLPLSTKYLALLAKDNDWVGFLTEALSGGFPVDVIIQVASKEFSDLRLKTHVLTVLRMMQLSKKKITPSTNPSSEKDCGISFLDEHNLVIPDQLFEILAECESQKNPGEALLLKAKNLRWSLLAVIASCFSDISPLSCLTVWLEITAARETSSIKVSDIYAKIAHGVELAIKSTNGLPTSSRTILFRYNRKNPKRRRLMEPALSNLAPVGSSPKISTVIKSFVEEISNEDEKNKMTTERTDVFNDPDDGLASLSNMVAVLCEQSLFIPLLRAFEMFLPSSCLLPFLRSLQAFSQMRLSEASAHLVSFSLRIKEEPSLFNLNGGKDSAQIKTAWINSTAVKAAEAVLSTCPSAYEKRCLLQLLSSADFGDAGLSSAYFRRLYWKINLAEPSLRRDKDLHLGDETLDDASLLAALEKNGHWEQARNWARQLESSSPSWHSAVHHVTETQAEAMVAEWKEFLWDVPEERAALWNHLQALFVRYSFPALQAGLFFLRHADSIGKDIPAKEIHDILLLALQWLSGTMTQSSPVYPLHLLREIETRIWLLAVESDIQSKAEGHFVLPGSIQSNSGSSDSIIDQTATVIEKMDNHINATRMRVAERNGTKETNQTASLQVSDFNNAVIAARMKRRSRVFQPIKRSVYEVTDSNNDSDEFLNSLNDNNGVESSKSFPLQSENIKVESSMSGWEEKVGPMDLERAVLSLLEFGQISAAKQLQYKFSSVLLPSELVLVDAALKLASQSSYCGYGEISKSLLDAEVLSVFQSYGILNTNDVVDPMQALESLATKCSVGSGRGICQRIIAVVRVAKLLGLTFPEAFEKRPIELLQLLSLKAQDSFEEAKFLVQTNIMTPSSIARVLAESFLKGLLAAHRGGYMDSQREEGPSPLLWRTSDFLKWAELCSSEQEIGHALMRLVMTGQDIPHACEVELLILAHHFYKSSACLDGVDVLVTLAANRVEYCVSEGDFACLARLITGVSNFRALNFILNILIENGQLELLLQKYSSAGKGTNSTVAARGFRMAVLTSLRLYNPNDHEAFTMVYNHFNMKHETAALLESRSRQHIQHWLRRPDKDWMAQDLLDAMRLLIEAAEVHSTIDAGHKTKNACSRALLLSLQIRIPDIHWMDLTDTNARRLLVEQTRFLEALVVAEAYNLNHPTEWAQVVLNHILRPEVVEDFMEDFVSVLPLQSSMLLEVARIYRSELNAREDNRRFGGWLSGGGFQPERLRLMGRSFRCLLKRTSDLRLRVQLATIATGFADVIDSCMKRMDKVQDNPAALILRKGHGGGYLPLM